MNLQAAGVIACFDGVNGDPTMPRTGACATQVNFSTLPPDDFVDWMALGSAHANGYNPAANSGNPWQALSSGGMTVSLNTGPDFTGASNMQRVDNGYLYNPGSGWAPVPLSLASMFTGHFNQVPNMGVGNSYGDNLVGFTGNQGPLLIQFSAPVYSVGFYISSKVSLSVDATVKAYSVLNPTSSDIPILSYRVTDTAGGGSGGSCPGLSQTPPVPCNDAPFLAIDGISQQFKSIVISSTDTRGFYIDTLYLGTTPGVSVEPDTPEPASALLIGGGLLLGIASCKFRARR
jgi:hypothetical protein